MEQFSHELIKTYKIPLTFGLVGIVLLIIGIVLSSRLNPSSVVKNGIEIIDSNSQATVSGRMTSILVVDIEGAIEIPGVYEMEDGTRLVDLLERAGGIRAEADSQWVAINLNKAQPLVDGVKIYIPFEGETASSESQVSDQTTRMNGTININTATSEQLETLSGIGSVTAGEIIDGRPYQRSEELLERKIVGPVTWEKIKDEISVF
ncbi:ComEA family DNA-binding protein [Candidatus Roizmanbacteria bacterium]|nr:ComEA family DNA-binding protein [Candidatus Roizmanbacteria bacterium]